MNRSIISGSKLCKRWDEQRKHDKHRERIRNMRPVIDVSEPYVLQMDHIRNNLKREQMMEERYSEIDRENRLLLKKMSDIMKTQSTPRTNEQIQSGPVSLNRDFRKRELLRITRENHFILKRIQQAQPTYNHIQWEADHRQNQSFANNCTEFPRAFISRRPELTPRSELLPLGADDLNERVPTTARSGAPQAKLPAIDAPTLDSLACVFTGLRQIGDGDFLVEMTTDGRVLNIAASSVELQKVLDLTINEQQHRRLFRESFGDYQILAQRLRVADSVGGPRLFLDDAEVREPLSASLPATARGPAPVSSRGPGPASSPPTARVEGGRAAKAAEGVRERTAAFMQNQQPNPTPRTSPPSAALPPRPRPAVSAKEPGEAEVPQLAKEKQSKVQPQAAPANATSRRKSRPNDQAKRTSAEEVDADAMVAARRRPSDGGNDSDEVVSQAATVYTPGHGTVPGSAGSAYNFEVDFNMGDAQVHLRGFTPDRYVIDASAC